MIADAVLTNAKAYIRRTVVDCSVAINEGKILKIGREVNMPKADMRFDVKNTLVLPGLVDVHVHMRDEGKSYKEDFLSGTAAAAAGGFTTVIDMPNNEPVTMSAAALRNRMNLAETRILVNVGFRSEFPRSIEEIAQIAREGAVGFKVFVSEQVGGLDIDCDKALLDAFRNAAKAKMSVAVHAEDRRLLKRNEDKVKHEGLNDIGSFLAVHSVEAERRAVMRVLSIAGQAGVHLHFCHITTEEGIEAVVEAKNRGMTISCEVTPHHLLLCVEDLEKIGMLGLTVPPLRNERHVDALWKAVRDGSIDMLASDHAPHTMKEKEASSVWDVKSGVPGLETTLPLLLTEVKHDRLTIADLVRLLSEKPAIMFSLEGKGFLREGNDADLAIIDLRKKFKVDSSEFHSKAKFSPFEGRMLEGKAVRTFVNGRLIMEDGEIVAKAGSGRVIRRENAA